MHNEDLSFNEVYYGANAAVFIAALLISHFSTKLIRSVYVRAAALCCLALCYSVAFITYSKQHNSKYKVFDVKRCANKREILSRFRVWSKTVHPDSQTDFQENALGYEELDALKDFLSDTTKRLFYDKFNIVYERQDFDEKESKEIYNYLFQNKLFDYLNLTFAWIFVTFLASRYLRRLELTNFILKILLAKSFLMIYYLYSQKIDSCSLMDSVFGHLTISQQIYYAEFWFSFGFGILTGLYNAYSEDSKRGNIEKVGQALKVLKDQPSRTEEEQKLYDNISRFYDYLSN